MRCGHGWLHLKYKRHLTCKTFTVYLCRYMAANQRCKTAEETINSETRNVEHYSKLVEERFNEVHNK